MIKKVGYNLSTPLAKVFNKFIEKGICPKYFKNADVIPTYKVTKVIYIFITYKYNLIIT